MRRMWIELEGLANLRDVGGMPTTDGGEIIAGRLLRSDNLQALTPADVSRLLQLGLTDVVDLRSDYEVEAEGPGPLAAFPQVHVHRHSLFKVYEESIGVGDALPDAEANLDTRADSDEELPWVEFTPTIWVDDQPVASFYLSYLADRPDSIIASLRHIGEAEGATLVHCAAGKDRTGTIVALALSVAGADRAAIVEDYAASSERMEAILERLLRSTTYADNLRDRPMSAHLTHPETMLAFLEYVDREYGGVGPLLATMGWTEADSERLRAKLRG